MTKPKKSKLIKSSVLIVAAMLTGLTAGCSQKEEVDISKQKKYSNISLSWWGTDVRNQYTLDAVQTFEDLHPNIKVETKYSDWTGYEKRMDIEVASATEADVMQINYAWINKYSNTIQRFYDLNELSDIIDLSQFSDDILEYGMEDGKLEAIPIALNAMTPYYNKTVFDSYNLEIPNTIQDLYKAAEVMSKDGIYPLSCANKGLWFLCVSLEEAKSGKHIYDESNNIMFDEENLSEVIQYGVDFVKNKVVPDLSSYDKNNISDGVYAGALMWISDGDNSFANAKENGYEIVVGNYLYDADVKKTEWYVKPATMYAISANTEYPEESAMLLDFLLNSKEMAEKQGIEKGIPVSKKADEILKEKNLLQGVQYDAFRKLDENMNVVTKVSPYFENSDIIQTFYDSVNKVLYTDYTTEQAAKDLMQVLKSESK